MLDPRQYPYPTLSNQLTPCPDHDASVPIPSVHPTTATNASSAYSDHWQRVVTTRGGAFSLYTSHQSIERVEVIFVLRLMGESFYSL